MKSPIHTKVLMKITDNPKDIWTIDDATKGTCILGGTGSGKTSASGRKIAKVFLKEGWGGIVLCAKNDEAAQWMEYCRETGREQDLIIFRNGAVHEAGEFEGQEMVFNPLDYEMRREGEGARETQNITNIFMNIYRMGNRVAGETDVKDERYWDSALKRCLNRIIELIKLSGEDLSYANMVRILNSASTVTRDLFVDSLVQRERKEHIEGIEKETRYCLKCLINAYFNINPEGDRLEKINAFDLVENYFTITWPGMDPKTRSIVSESFFGLAEPFLSGLLFKHFSGATNIFPEWTYEKQKIIILDFPIKEFLDSGIIAQCVFKLMFQQAVERRNTNKYPMPVFLWGDEYQYFVNAYDQVFLTTARSSRTASVFLSQNISNYIAMMGSGSETKAKVDSLLGNLCTKIFHANTDAETNEYASRLIGHTVQQLANTGHQHTTFSLQDSYSQGMTSQYLPQIQPRIFTTLKTGGHFNAFEVHAIMNVSGKQWSNGKNYLSVSFTQSFKN